MNAQSAQILSRDIYSPCVICSGTGRFTSLRSVEIDCHSCFGIGGFYNFSGGACRHPVQPSDVLGQGGTNV